LSGAEVCPGPAELARRVDALLKRSAFVEPGSAKRFFQVSIQPNASGVGWQVLIVVSNEADETLGTRELSVPQPACADAVDATALALALMIDPNERAASAAFELPAKHEAISPPSPAAPSEPIAKDVAGDAAPPARTAPAAPPSPSHWRTRLGLGFFGALGALPETSLGALGGVRVSPTKSAVGVDFSAGYVGLQRTELSAQSGAEFGAVLAGIGVWGVPWSAGKFHLSLAGGGQFWRITGCGFGFSSTNGCQSSLLIAATADAEFAWQFDEHWGFALRPGMSVPFVRDTFQFTASDAAPRDIFRPSAVIGWLTASVVVAP
jgi:hypothetical protein